MNRYVLIFLALGCLIPVATSLSQTQISPQTHVASTTLCLQKLTRVSWALENYRKEHRGNLPSRLSGLVPKYLERTSPQCIDENHKDFVYRTFDDNNAYEIYCPSGFHACQSGLIEGFWVVDTRKSSQPTFQDSCSLD